jgi:hypothetical protein
MDNFEANLVGYLCALHRLFEVLQPDHIAGEI